MEMRGNWLFWDYLKEYGIFDEERLEYVGLKDDAPEEVKKSWAEYQKLEAKWREEGTK